MPSQAHHLGIATAAARLQSRELTAVGLADRCLARVEEFNPRLNAFITVLTDSAREQAAERESEIDAGQRRGLLLGDADAVAALKAAGAIIIGKTKRMKRTLTCCCCRRPATTVLTVQQAAGTPHALSPANTMFANYFGLPVSNVPVAATHAVCRSVCRWSESRAMMRRCPGLRKNSNPHARERESNILSSSAMPLARCASREPASLLAQN